jgi:hypothetical protein
MYTVSLSLSHEGSARLFSLSVSLVILIVHELFVNSDNQYYGVLYSMQIFFSYLLIDLLFRSTPLPRDALIHHSVGLFIVGFGFYELLQKKEFYVYISPFLRMEATTPFLHSAWILYNEKSVMNKSFAKFFFVLVLFLWIPFRLFYPTQTTYALFGFGHESKPNVILTTKERTIGAPFFFSFCILQYYWFAKLVTVLCSQKKYAK